MECFKNQVPVRIFQDLFQFECQARRRGMDNELNAFRDRRFRFRIHCEIILPDELQGAQNADGVFFKPQDGIADRTDGFCRQVLHAHPCVVHDFVVDRIIENRVDGEIAPPCVFFRSAEFVVLKDHVLGSLFPGTAQFCLVLRALAERADLNDFPVVVQVNQTETLADDQDMAVPEYFLDLFGRRRGGKVVILRLTVQQEVADRAADNVCFVTCVLELGNDFDNVRCDFRA